MKRSLQYNEDVDNKRMKYNPWSLYKNDLHNVPITTLDGLIYTSPEILCKLRHYQIIFNKCVDIHDIKIYVLTDTVIELLQYLYTNCLTTHSEKISTELLSLAEYYVDDKFKNDVIYHIMSNNNWLYNKMKYLNIS